MKKALQRNPKNSLTERTSYKFSGWQEKLALLDVNTIHPSRTCDTFFMLELQESYITAIRKFHRGSKLVPSNDTKCITYEDILLSIKYFANAVIQGTKINEQLYKEAAQEAILYVNGNQPIPCDLMAKLIKLELIDRIKKDVSEIQSTVYIERLFESERKQLSINPNQADAKGKKDKGKANKSDKSKADKGKKGKSENKYDICDPNNVFQPKQTSKLLKVASNLFNKIEVQPKHLYFVITSFYDVNLIKELNNINIQMTGIIELCKVNHCVFPVLDYKTVNSKLISQFWSEIYDYMHSENECPKFLKNVYQMTIPLMGQAFDKATLNDDNYCQTVFNDLSQDVHKFNNIKRNYVNYIRHLKIQRFDSKPKPIPITNLKVYASVINVLPPECCTLFPIMYSLIEDLSDRIPHSLSLKKSSTATVTGFNLSSKESSTIRSELLHTNIETNRSIKCCTADILKTSVTKTTSTLQKIKYDAKVNIKISTKPILVDENNDLELLLNSYKKLYPKLLTIHLDKFVQSQSVLLWKKYPLEFTNSCDCLKKRADIRSILDTLDLTVNDVEYLIHAIHFNAIKCKSKVEKLGELIFHLQINFPKKDWFAPNVNKEKMAHHIKIHPIKMNSKESINLNVPEIEYTKIPNVYEAKNIFAYKWYEPLNELVMLQELSKAERDYLCMDHVYSKYDDTILLRFHNDLDEYGVNNKRWKESMRTSLGIREFCKYIVQEEPNWLLMQEKLYQDECDRQKEEAKKQKRGLRQPYYPDLVFTDMDFLHKGSLKEKLLQGDKIDLPPPGKKEKDKKDKGKKEKKGTASTAKPTIIPLLEKLSQPVTVPEPRKLTLREREAEEPFKFHAYDVSTDRFQLAGATTAFCSRDGYKVTIDTARFSKHSKNLSLDACVDGNSFILHYNKTTIARPFGFHTVLSDNTYITFSKPEKKIEPEEFICEKICKSVKRKQMKTQELYFVSEKQLAVTKCFKIPQITKRNLIMSEELLTSFLHHLNVRRIQTKLVPTKSLSNEDFEKFQKALGSEDSYETGSTDSNVSEHPSQIEVSVTDFEREPSFQYQTYFDRSKEFSDTHLRQKDATQKKILKKLKKTLDAEMPVFKICSSPLHKYHYVKRVKSHVEMQIGTLFKRITYKQPVYKKKINLQISKLLPVKKVDPKPATYAYKMKTYLPSGLLVETVETNNKAVFNIRQKYLDKGPQCQRIHNEHSRTFTRNGNIIIKKTDGDIDVINVHGEIVKCEIPLMHINNKPVVEKREKPNLATLNVTKLTSFQKHLHKSINRMKRHVIDNPKSKYLMSHKASARLKKQVLQDQDQIYIIQDSIAPFKRFSLLTTDGKLLKIIPSLITEEERLYNTTFHDYRFEETLSEREDGVQTKIDRDSSLVTQFADGTRISTWLDIEPNLLYLVDPADLPPGKFAQKEQQTDTFEIIDDTEYEDEDEYNYEEEYENSIRTSNSNQSKSECEEKIEGWVSIFLNFKYEHPNYATVIFYGQNNNTEIILPNDVSLASTSNGEYTMTLKKATAQITTEKILLEAKLCNECLQTSTLNFNIKPLYVYKKKDTISPTTQFFRTTDTFGKSFKVTYDGKCAKDAYYEESGSNLVDCKKHYAYEPQKLFILKRSLLGSKLWDINAYKKRLIEGMRFDDTIVKNHDECFNRPHVELRTKVRKSNYEKFLILYEEPFLVLSKNKSKKNIEKEPAYITQKIICKLPIIPHVQKVFSKFLEICSSQYPTFLHSVQSEFESLLIQLHYEAKTNKKTESVEEESSYSFPSEQFIMTMEMRYEMWLQQLEHCKREYDDRFVPKYFDLSYGYSTFGTDAITLPVSCSSESGESGESGESDDSLLCRCDLLNKLETSKSSTPPGSVQESKEPDEHKVEISYRDYKNNESEDITDLEFIDIEAERPSKTSKTVPSEMLLNETKNIIIKIAMDMPCDHSLEASEKKVKTATKLLYDNLMTSVKEYRSRMPIENYIVCTATVAIKQLSIFKLNALEWILLWNNVTAFTQKFLRKVDSYETLSFTPKNICETSKDCTRNVSFKDSLLTTKDDKHISAFDIYSNLYSELKCYEKRESDKRNISMALSQPDDQNDLTGRTISEVLQKCEKLPNSILNVTRHISHVAAKSHKHKPLCKKCMNIWNFSQKSEFNLTSFKTFQTSSDEIKDEVEFSFQSPLSSTDDEIEPIDSHTEVLKTIKNGAKEHSSSLNVLFSIASLKFKHESETFFMPYSQKLPCEGLQSIIMNNKLGDKMDRREAGDQAEEIDPVNFSNKKVSTVKTDKPSESVDAKILDSDVKSFIDPFSKVRKITPTRLPYGQPLRKSLGLQVDVSETDQDKRIETSNSNLYSKYNSVIINS